ncbi:adenylate/guanylate cyclase domain-containing protein [uncultured Tateyamaria sp.]|uniref:adenylate/guanylate cyclase domain-containing protein n=1 Tax=uncultured Tateyamaria sp. TaxID=455651 RepID=UPI00261403FA|nr:adenylate/guanylate cyclase domain-containing protein [uncultured Tateyamaria sp.]
MSASEQVTPEAQTRLNLAEQRGLRLGIGIRTSIAAAAFVWYVGAALLFPGADLRLATTVALLLFTAIGVTHLCLIGTRFDRAWMKYTVYMLDGLTICALFALVPISRADDVPQIIAFRAYGIYFLFPLLAMACLSLSWRLVLWTGTVCVVGWWAAFAWVSTQMDRTLSWADIPSAATRADYETIFLSIDFIGRGNRIEETAMLFFAAIALSVSVYRARAVFFAQVAADIDRRREKAARERVSDLLGKYVPEEIAHKLIADDAPMRPQRATGTALVMDIAGFTRFSAAHDPSEVIAKLDTFLADAARAVSDKGGIVISYLGDGFLVTFNAPVAVKSHATAAVQAATALVPVARAHAFDIRVGIATGALVTGIIGSDSRQSFTVYGDAVNLAARLEGKCKELGVQILMDDQTRASAGVAVDVLNCGDLLVDGIETPVQAFGLSGVSVV